MKTTVIMNEQHSLLPSQEDLLKSHFETFDFLRVPDGGWTAQEMREMATSLEGRNVVFVSPVPVLLAIVSARAGASRTGNMAEKDGAIGFAGPETHVFVMHNDHREKKELPNGKVVMTVAREGWEIVPVA